MRNMSSLQNFSLPTLTFHVHHCHQYLVDGLFLHSEFNHHCIHGINISMYSTLAKYDALTDGNICFIVIPNGLLEEYMRTKFSILDSLTEKTMESLLLKLVNEINEIEENKVTYLTVDVRSLGNYSRLYLEDSW